MPLIEPPDIITLGKVEIPVTSRSLLITRSAIDKFVKLKSPSNDARPVTVKFEVTSVLIVPVADVMPTKLLVVCPVMSPTTAPV